MNITLNATGIWLGVFTVFYILLALHVVRMRWVTKTGLGVGEDRRMLKAVRIHGNFSEYIPLMILSIALLEIRGISSQWIHTLFCAAFLGRVLICIGITKTSNFSIPRFSGNNLTFMTLLAAGIWHFILSL